MMTSLPPLTHTYRHTTTEQHVCMHKLTHVHRHTGTQAHTRTHARTHARTDPHMHPHTLHLHIIGSAEALPIIIGSAVREVLSVRERERYRERDRERRK